jgi:hypothetical protein
MSPLTPLVKAYFSPPVYLLGSVPNVYVLPVDFEIKYDFVEIPLIISPVFENNAAAIVLSPVTNIFFVGV